MKVEVVLGPNFTQLSKSAFYGSGILSIDMSQSKIRRIIAETFYNCKFLSSVKLPPNCENIEDGSFYGASITELQIGHNITSIGENAFAYCDNLMKIKIDDKSILQSIQIGAFINSRITVIIFPSSLISIGTKSFQNNANLCNITFIDTEENPGSLESISADAFDGCNSLEEVRLPKSIQSLNPTSFSICRKLMNIIIGDGVSYQTVNGAVFSKDKLTLVICPNGRTEFVIRSDIRYIGHKAFMNCKNLNYLKFEKDSLIESLNTSVFEGCSALKSVVFSDNSKPNKNDVGSKLKEIGDKVFRGCSSLEEFLFHSNIYLLWNSKFEC